MAKKSGTNLILLGVLAIGGYLLYKSLTGGQQQQGGGYNIGWIPGDTTPQTPMNDDSNLPGDTTPTNNNSGTVTISGKGNIFVNPFPDPAPKQTVTRPLLEYTLATGKTLTIPAPIGVTQETLVANKTSQAWTAATYGQPGQPGVSFLANTVLQSQAKYNPPATVKMAAAGIAAGAPPRLVAKMKAGSAY